MDHSKIKERRWFFRPVLARLIGYAGQFKKSTEKKEVEEPISTKREEVVSSEDEEPVKKLKASSAKKSKEPVVSSEDEESVKKSKASSATPSTLRRSQKSEAK
jgi:hypothetical protein